jgi:hypothetical protein
MAEALISRRGGAVFEEEVHAYPHALTSPFLIGAKNALIGLCPNPDHPYTSEGGELIVSIAIEDGEITSAYCNSSGSVSKIQTLSFDSANGMISQPGIAMGEFATFINYKVVVY